MSSVVVSVVREAGVLIVPVRTLYMLIGQKCTYGSAIAGAAAAAMARTVAARAYMMIILDVK